MELSEAIYTRRTIKDFKPDPVSGEALDRALTAGTWAQNHRLTEPWRFTILGPETHRKLAEVFAGAQATSAGDPSSQDKIRADARQKILSKPCVVVVSQVLGAPHERQEDYGAISCAIQNIQLAAWAEGLGMQWSSGKIVRLPQTYEVAGIVAAQEEIVGLLFFGHPASVPPPQPRTPLAAVARRLP